VAIRLGGPVSQANALVPVFYNLITSLEMNPPGSIAAQAFMSAAGSAAGSAISDNMWEENHPGWEIRRD